MVKTLKKLQDVLKDSYTHRQMKTKEKQELLHHHLVKGAMSVQCRYLSTLKIKNS